MIEKFRTALVLAPHTDDGEFGCGGTMARLIESGVEVTYVAFSTAAKSVPEGFPRDILRTEVRQATSIIGIDEAHLRRLIRRAHGQSKVTAIRPAMSDE